MPVAEKLKEEYPDRWARFNTLPESKRYPNNEEEYSIIMGRHIRMLNQLLVDQEILAITSEWSSDSTPPEVSEFVKKGLIPEATYWQTIKEDQGPESTTYRHIYVATLILNGEKLKDLLRAVADDAVSGVILSGSNLDLLYHPYDGGVDIILASQEQRDNLREQYKEWLQ